MKKYFSLLLFLLLPLAVFGQENLSSDELFQEARNAAFEKKDYPTAIELSKQALEKSPNYTDISVFLGRLYTWSEDAVSARAVFKGLDDEFVEDEDFFLAYTSLEYWNDQNDKALEIVNKGLSFHPESESLLLLKAKIAYNLENYKEAENTINSLLSVNPENTDARALLIRNNNLRSKNAVGITYNYSHFDKQFSDDWHIVGLSYRRVTPIGSVILRGNYANKFAASGTQIELEAYPKLSELFYLYLGAGYSNDVGIFPKYRTGVSLNANLPKSFEAEIGYRQLYFTDNILLYTASIGKYYKNYWFNIRTYLTPDNDQISHSYTGTVRYYLKGADDFLSFKIGSGISPEEYQSNLLENKIYKLKTFKIGLDYEFSVLKTNLFSIGTMFYRQEYLPGTKGNQYDFTIGYIKRF